MVPQRSELNHMFGEWVLAPWNLIQMGTLSEERVVKLNEIGFNWEVRCSPKAREIWFVYASSFRLSIVIIQER